MRLAIFSLISGGNRCHWIASEAREGDAAVALAHGARGRDGRDGGDGERLTASAVDEGGTTGMRRMARGTKRSSMKKREIERLTEHRDVDDMAAT
jgi:hypothetical protein